MKVTYPDTGWFHIQIGKYIGQVSYLDFPFSDLCEIVINAYNYNAPGSLVMDAEGYDNIFVYDYITKKFQLWNTETGKKYLTKQYTKKQIMKNILPAFGLLAMYLYFGPNIIEFTTAIVELDYDITEEEAQSRDHLTWVIHQKDNNRKNYYYNNIRHAIANTASILNTCHHISQYKNNELNPDWVKENINCIRSFMAHCKVDITNKKDVSNFLEKIILGQLKPEMNILSFLGMYGVYNLFCMTNNKEERQIQFEQIVSNILASQQVHSENFFINIINKKQQNNQILGQINQLNW